VATPATGVRLPSIDCLLSLDEVYRDLRLVPAAR
jgi:hypothetical protein